VVEVVPSSIGPEWRFVLLMAMLFEIEWLDGDTHGKALMSALGSNGEEQRNKRSWQVELTEAI
jgi:hypothetical protein